MTLYEQLQADPTLRVYSQKWGISQSIFLFDNKIVSQPIRVRFESGLVVTFSEHGEWWKGHKSHVHDICIVQQEFGTPHPYDFDNSAVVNGNIHCEPINETLSIYED